MWWDDVGEGKCSIGSVVLGLNLSLSVGLSVLLGCGLYKCFPPVMAFVPSFTWDRKAPGHWCGRNGGDQALERLESSLCYGEGFGWPVS